MKVLFTGGSSAAGARILQELVENNSFDQIWCVVHRNPIRFHHPKLKTFSIDLKSDQPLPSELGNIDLTIHFAGITHSKDVQDYRKFNHDASKNLMNKTRDLGCRKWVYISTRCAHDSCGEYGASKLAFESELLKHSWDRLLILRPSEIYAGSGQEGMDKLIKIAKKLHVVPMFFGNKGIQFSPLHIDDFVNRTTALINQNDSGVQILNFCGPESLSGIQLSLRLAKKFVAIPVPIFWPFFSWAMNLLTMLGLPLTPPDQLARLVGQKTATLSSPNPLLSKNLRAFP